MSSGKRVLRGAAWSYGSQVVTIVVQLVYAAITTRIVGAEDFGIYAIALSTSALFSILATGGIGQAVARLHRVDPRQIASLYSVAIILGVLGALALYLAAPFIATLWATPAATKSLQVVSLIALFSPSFGLLTGLDRRLGRFARLSMLLLASNIVGFALGAISVALWANASTLLVSPIVAYVLPTIALSILARKHISWRHLFRLQRSDATHVTFSLKVMASRLISYVNWNLGKYVTTVALGVSTFGYWNRADVVTTVPATQIQLAVTQAVYPEFRHDIDDSSRAKRIWADMLGLGAWLYWPLAAIAMVLSPVVIPILFGPSWTVSAEMAPALALAAGVQGVLVLLGSAIEALGRFRLIWGAQTVFLAVQIGGGLLAIVTQSWMPAIFALIIGSVVQHAIHITALTRSGHLEGRAVAQHYSWALVSSAALGGALWVSVQAIHQTPLWIIPTATVAVGAFATLWLLRRRLPPVRLAKLHGIL